MGPKRNGWILLPLLCAVFFANSFPGAFHFDDEHALLRNPHIRSLGNIPAYFSPGGADYFSGDADKRMYRPLLLTSFALNYAVDGYESRFYVAVNWLLHLGCTLLVWRLGLRFLPPAAALWAAALFALHPLACEPVNYISSRSESLAALLILSALLLHWRGQVGWALLALALALASKAIAVALPPVLWWLDRGLLRRRMPNGAYAAYGGLSAAYLVLVFADRWGQVSQALPVRDALTQGWTQLKAPVYYLGLLASPARLNVEHQFFEDGGPSLAGGLALALVLSLGALLWRVRGSLWGWAALWSAALLAPTMLMPLNVLVNERRLYLVVAACVWALAAALYQRGAPAPRLGWALWGLPLCLGALAVERNAVWADERRLWEDAVAKAPAMYRAQANVGKARQRAGDDVGALAAYRAALALDERFPAVYNNIAIIEHERGRTEEALVWYEKSLALDDGIGEVWQNLADAHTVLGQRAEAARAYRRAVALTPDNAGLWNNYGQALEASGRAGAAEEALTRASALDPSLSEPHNNLGNLFSGLGRFAEAEAQYRAALAKEPENPAEVWANLADLHRQTGALARADSAIGAALELEGDNGRYWALKGRVARQAGRGEDALAAFERSLRHRPHSARVLAELGELLAAAGAVQKALVRYEAALRLDSGYSRAWYGLAEAALRAGDGQKARAAYAAFLEEWPHRDRRYERAVAFLRANPVGEGRQ